MGPQRGRGPIPLDHEFRYARSGGLLAVGLIECLDHLVG
jgi:hypothetical protein